MRMMLALVLVASVAACGSSDDDATGELSDTTTSTTSTSAPVETTTEVPALDPAPAAPAPGDFEMFVTVPGGSRERRVVLHAPDQIDDGAPVPLVLVFHGTPGRPEEMIEDTGMNDVADEHGFLVAYPQALSRTEEVGAVVDLLVESWNVDPARVHASGFSRGATLVYDLAMDLPGRFGSVAPVSGVRPGTVTITEPVSLITFQGGEDNLARSFDQLNDAWATAASCEPPTETDAQIDGGAAVRSAATCAGDVEHVVYEVPEMGHDWPPEASALIWEFFAAHPAGP